MAVTYITSNKINVFPSVYRSVIANGKYTSEANITNILKCLTSQDSFVCDEHSLVVGGYYFELDNSVSIPDLHSTAQQLNTYAYIMIENGSNRLVSNTGSTSLDSGDATGNFKGLMFDTSVPAAASGCKVASLQVRNTDGEIVNTKRFDFNTIQGTKTVTEEGVTTTTTISMSDMFNADMTLKEEYGGTGLGDLSSTTVGTATQASKLSDTSQKGSTSAPVYFNNGVPVACGNNLIVQTFTGRLEGTSDKSQKLVTSSGGSETPISAGNSTTPVYFNNGVPVACGQSLGVDISGTSETSNAFSGGAKGSYNQCVYLNSSGAPTVGFKVTVSQSAPTGSDVGTNGDLWIVY